jgi:hypothetical protein
MAGRFRCRPSELLGINDPYPAYCLDEAVWEWGESLDLEMRLIEDKDPKMAAGKRQNRLLQLLGEEQRFARPTKGR